MFLEQVLFFMRLQLLPPRATDVPKNKVWSLTLAYVSKGGSIEPVARRLSTHPHEVNETHGDDESTAVALAVLYGNMPIVQLLHKAGGSFHTSIQTANVPLPLITALIFSYEDEKESILRYMLSSGDVSVEQRFMGDTLLQTAINLNCQLTLIKALLSYGASPCLYGIVLSALFEPFEILDMLWDHGADMAERNYENSTALHLLCDGDTPQVERLHYFSRFMDIDVVNENGETPLHRCMCKLLHADEEEAVPIIAAILFLISEGSNPYLVDRDGDSAVSLVDHVTCIPRVELLKVLGVVKQEKKPGI